MIARASVAWLLLGACAQQAYSTDPAAITNGTAADDRAVVALAGRREVCPSPGPGVTCSAVVVGPQLLLTAAHCFEELFAAGQGLDDVEIFAGADAATGQGDWRAIDAARLHPDYDPATRLGDLALVLLDAEIPGATPVPLGTLPADGSAVGATVRLVGFGITESSISPGVRRTGTAVIESYDATTVRLAPSPSLSCSGDSGGAVLLDDGAGERLIAIVRSGDAACSQYSVATRVDAHAAFLEPALDATDPLVGDGRLPPDPDADFCAGECADDLDCPDGMRCLDERTARRCGYPAVRSGTFGATCASSADCGGAICAGVGAGAAHECRCLDACPAEGAGEGGCAVGGSGGAATALALLALAAVLRRRIAACAPRTSSPRDRRSCPDRGPGRPASPRTASSRARAPATTRSPASSAPARWARSTRRATR